MGDVIEDAALYNCTALLLLQMDPDTNVNSVWMLNRSQVLDILDVTLTEEETSAKWTVVHDFISECLFPSQRPYDLAWWQKLVWTVVFAAMLVVATGGNTIVMWIVLGKQCMFYTYLS
jgi:tachykinin-like receptor